MKPAPFQYFQPATIDEALAMLHRCFAGDGNGDEVEVNGQRFLFRPRQMVKDGLKRLGVRLIREKFFRRGIGPGDFLGGAHFPKPVRIQIVGGDDPA